MRRLTLQPQRGSSAAGSSTAGPALAASLAAVSEFVPWCAFRLGPPPGGVLADPSAALLDGGWLRCSDALDGGRFFDRWQRALAARMAASYGCATVPPVAPAGYVMSWYCGVFGFLGGLLFHRARRVPSLAPENLAVRIDPVACRPAEVAVLGGGFACLPSDRACEPGGSGDPCAAVLPDDGALAAALRAEVAAHGERFVESYRAASRFGPHTLWGAVTDALDRGLWHIAHRRGEDAAGAADAALVLPRRLPPFTSGSTVRQVRGPSGTRHWTRTRQSCCFYYTLPGVPAPCPTCPRLTEEQRAQLLD